MLAVGIYSILSIAFFGWPLADLTHRCACAPSRDPEEFMWFLAWWPHAITSGINPFVTHSIFGPGGFDLASATSIPGVSVAAWPLTATIGPLASYNVVALLAPVLSGWAAFALCRYVTGETPPALVGGAMFGFSTYELAQLEGHPHLDLVFALPIAALLTLRVLDRRLRPRPFVILMASTIVLELLISTEVTATMCFVGLVALVSAYVAGGHDLRARLRLTSRYITLALLLAVAVTSPLLYYALFKGFPSMPLNVGDRIAIDGLGWFIPWADTRFGAHHFASIADHFTAGAPADAYQPLPLLALAAAALVSLWRRVSGRVAAVVIAVTGILALGAHLHIAGKAIIPLPWRLVENAPVTGEIAPGRFSVYVTLVVAVLTALALRRGLSRLRLRWAMAAVGLVLLTPNSHSDFWRARPSNPPFFTNGAYKRALIKNELVLALPSPIVDTGPNLWQAETDFYFRMADGYISQIFPPDYPADPLWRALVTNRVDGATPEFLRSFVVRHHIQAVLVDGSQPGPWPRVLAQLGTSPEATEGILVYRFAPDGRAAP